MRVVGKTTVSKSLQNVKASAAIVVILDVKLIHLSLGIVAPTVATPLVPFPHAFGNVVATA